MACKALLAAFYAIFLSVSTSACAEPLVGTLGRPEKLAIHGAKRFSPDEIREELFNDLDLVAACAPDYTLETLLRVIRGKVLAGYRGAGFFDVDVSVTALDDGLVVTIEEGERFANGKIEVVGNRHVDVEQIRSQLTRPEAARLKPRRDWAADEPASFARETEAHLTEKVLTLVNDQGYYRATLTVKIVPDRAARQATLHIDVSDEGPLATLGDVMVTGNERNSRDAIMAYLALDVAAPLTRELREQTERRLLASGRFLSVRWELGKPEERGDSWRPRLALEEYESAPPIDKPLSREETALLKVAEWFERLEARSVEIVFEEGGGENVLVFAPQRGFIALVKPWDDEPPEADGPAFDYVIVLDEERVGLYSSRQRSKIVAEPPPSPVIGEATLSVVQGAPTWDGKGKITFGAGLSSNAQKGYRRHVELHFKLTAPAALSLLYKHQAKQQWDGDVLSLEWDDRRLRINGVTGEFIEHVVRGGSADGDQAVSVRLAAKPGEFERRRCEIELASADWPNLADARRPLSCLAEFACTEMEWIQGHLQRHAGDALADFTDDDDPSAVARLKDLREEIAADLREHYAREARGYWALRKAISRGMLRPFDRLLFEHSQPPRETFSIPQSLFHVRFRSLDDFVPLIRELAPLFGVRMGNALFPANSWMNAAWHQGIFAIAKKRTALPPKSASADKSGPLSHLATAEMLRVAGADWQSATYALTGMRGNPAAAFRDECRELVSGDGFVSEVLRTTAATMRQLDAADIAALLGLFVELEVLDQKQAAALELAALRAHAEDSPTKAVSDAMDALWMAGLSSWMERRFGELYDPPE